MDALGHVNNVMYFRYMESARIDLFENLGYTSINPMSEQGPILAYINCQYKAPVTFPDTLLVSSEIHHIGNTSFKIGNEIFSTAQQQVVATGDSVTVLVNYQTGEKLTVPDEIRARFAQDSNPSS